MKNYFSLFFILITALIISSFTKSVNNRQIQSTSYEVPEDINAIFDKSCIMCHNKDAKNEKSKGKLMLDGMAELTKSQQISKLSKISKAVKKGEMPPEKFIAKYPEKALSDDDKKALVSWSKNYAKELAK